MSDIHQNLPSYDRATLPVSLTRLHPAAADVVRNPEQYQHAPHLIFDAWLELKEQQGAPINRQQAQRLQVDWRNLFNRAAAVATHGPSRDALPHLASSQKQC